MQLRREIKCSSKKLYNDYKKLRVINSEQPKEVLVFCKSQTKNWRAGVMRYHECNLNSPQGIVDAFAQHFASVFQHK